MAQYILFDLKVGPEAISVLLFAVALVIIAGARAHQNPRSLFVLPIVFLLWANLHGQVVVGLFLLATFVTVTAVEQFLRLPFSESPLSSRAVLVPAALSLLATLINPYGYRALLDGFRASYGSIPFEYFGNMSPLGFRRPQDFAMLLLAMAAFVALGRQRPKDLFQHATLVLALLAGLRMQRDAWILVLTSTLILGDGLSVALAERCSVSIMEARERVWIGSIAVILLIGAGLRMPSNDALLNELRRALPVAASNAIREQSLPQPMFNAYGWGSFLAWYLPQYPVAIDSRVTLYGDEFTREYFLVTEGKERMESNPSFSSSRTFLLERNSALAKALTTIPALQSQFRMAYQDDISVVLVRQ